MADYQSKYTGPEIDNAVGKSNSLFNGVTPLDPSYGGTGVTSIEALKNLLGTGGGGGGGITGVVPVNKGGTGATSAANARKNLGITPDSIGALGNSGNQTLKGVFFVERPDYSSVSLVNTDSNIAGKLLLFGHRLQLWAYNVSGSTDNYRRLEISDSDNEKDFGKALRVTSKSPAGEQVAYIITTANLKNEMQNAFKGGASVVKSVQRGNQKIEKDNTTATVTISAVNPDKSVVNMSAEYNVGGSATHQTPSIRLESDGTLKIHVPSNTGGITAYWQVIEFY